MVSWQAGIDVGGTNTDLLMVNPNSGETRVQKVPSTPEDQSQGVHNALNGAGIPLGDVSAIVHGTTIATNAVLERKGARCGLITTRGFRDVLELGRRTRPRNYGMIGSFEPLIDREFRLEVNERVDASGRVLIPLDEGEVRTALQKLLELGAEAVVIHFLHSYTNPAHEQRAAEIARNIWPSDHITYSSEILREVREFERGSTAAINAFIQPVLSRYLRRMSDRLSTTGFPSQLLVMQGNGGFMAADLAARQPVQTVMSGPSAGAIAAARIGQQSGFSNLIACDMGGTSFDVSLIRNGIPAVTAEKDIAYGVPVRVPMVDIHTIGAGGGSIAHVDAGGILRIGPESAGATPGPVCYGRGGTRPTVTDANVILGRIDPTSFSGVESKAAMQAVEIALEEHIGRALGLDTFEAASAILAVAGNQLASAIRLVSIEKGHDPRDFALFPFGGAGALHAVSLARELGIPKVLVPRFPGITSALGCVLADLRHDFVHTVWRPLADVEPSYAEGVLTQHAARGRKIIAEEGAPITDIEIVFEADLLYRGQSHVFRIPVSNPGFTVESVTQVLAERYKERFEIELQEMVPILASLRTTVIGRRAPLDLELFGPFNGAGVDVKPQATRKVFFDTSVVETPIFARDSLAIDYVIQGPAIIQQADSTIVLDPGASTRTDRLGNLVIDVNAMD